MQMFVLVDPSVLVMKRWNKLGVNNKLNYRSRTKEGNVFQFLCLQGTYPWTGPRPPGQD